MGQNVRLTDDGDMKVALFFFATQSLGGRHGLASRCVIALLPECEIRIVADQGRRGRCRQV